jgi:deoxyadenosine/deoxycytidine kinase
VGAGKSTVVKPLASCLGFRAWPERVADNPFFPRFVHDRAEWAFRSQAAFLISASEDAAMARRQGVGGVIERPPQEMLGVFVHTLQDEHLLDTDEVRLLTKILALSERLSGVPDVLVALRAAPDTLLARIRARRFTDEDAYRLSDIERLSAAYDRWISGWRRSPVIEVDVDTRDLRDPGEITRLATEVRKSLNGGQSTYRRVCRQ